MMQNASVEKKVEVPIIVKADVHGSKEAIEQSLIKMESEKVDLKIIHSGVGEINESDVTLATASNAKIFGFNVKANVQAKSLSKREKISMKYFSIIYEIIDEAKKIIEGLSEEEFVDEFIGKALIKKVFELSNSTKVAGCLVEEGKVTSKSLAKIYRNGNLVDEAFVENLKREKNQVKDVISGLECGISFQKFNEIEEGDKAEFFIRVKNEKSK